MAASAEQLLNLLLRHGSLSRADLAKAMHLSRPAVSGLVDGLIRQGVLRETGCGASNGGKPPIMLEPVAERFGTIGVDIGHETLLRGVLCDASGKQLAVMELPHGNTFESISEQALKLAAALKAAASIPVAGFGVAVAGQVDHAANEIVYCANFPLKNRGLAERLAAGSGLTVRLDNRARAAAQWEYYFGAADNAEDFIFISAERGIGTAIYLDGKLFSGRAGVAGEIRSLLLPSPDGIGLLPVEQAMSEKFLLELSGNCPDTAGLVTAWRRGEPGAVCAVDYLIGGTVYVTGLLTNLLDPALIVLGGRFRDLGPEFARELATRLKVAPPRQLEFRLSKSGRIGAALGAALGVILENCKSNEP